MCVLCLGSSIWLPFCHRPFCFHPHPQFVFQLFLHQLRDRQIQSISGPAAQTDPFLGGRCSEQAPSQPQGFPDSMSRGNPSELFQFGCHPPHSLMRNKEKVLVSQQYREDPDAHSRLWSSVQQKDKDWTHLERVFPDPVLLKSSVGHPFWEGEATVKGLPGRSTHASSS